jgi:hypothetical protein
MYKVFKVGSKEEKKTWLQFSFLYFSPNERIEGQVNASNSFATK